MGFTLICNKTVLGIGLESNVLNSCNTKRRYLRYTRLDDHLYWMMDILEVPHTVPTLFPTVLTTGRYGVNSWNKRRPTEMPDELRPDWEYPFEDEKNEATGFLDSEPIMLTIIIFGYYCRIYIC